MSSRQPGIGQRPAYPAYGYAQTARHGARTAFVGLAPDSIAGWYPMNLRLYASNRGCFISPDPLGPFDAGGMNRYAYCSGDPVNRVDPSGNAWWDWVTGALQRLFGDIGEQLAAAIITPGMAALADDAARPVAPVRVRRKQGYVRTDYEFRGGQSRIRHYQGSAAVAKKIPHRLETIVGSTGNYRIRPQWHALPNASGGVNHAADTMINATQVKGFMAELRKRSDSLPVVVLSGVHGAPSGLNWSQGVRVSVDRNVFFQDAINKGIMTRLSGRQVEVVDMGGVSVAEFGTLTEKPAHVVHAYCYGLADRALMTMHAVEKVRVYDL